MPKSVLDAIRMGLWDYEPAQLASRDFDSTDAMPGTPEKVEALASRVRFGQPLWHPLDRDDLDEPALRPSRVSRSVGQANRETR